MRPTKGEPGTASSFGNLVASIVRGEPGRNWTFRLFVPFLSFIAGVNLDWILSVVQITQQVTG